MTGVAIDVYGRNQQRWNAANATNNFVHTRPNCWVCNPRILVDIFYNRNSAPLDVDLNTRVGNMNLIVTVTNRPPPANAIPAPSASSSSASEPAPVAETTASHHCAELAPAAAAAAASSSHSLGQAQQALSKNGTLINIFLRNQNRHQHYQHHQHQPRYYENSRFSNPIVDQFLKQANNCSN